MKNKLILSILIIASLCSFKKDSCDLDALYEQALTKLKKFHLVKEYKISQKKNKDAPEFQYFPVTLNSGVKYRFYALDNAELEGRLVICIYNNMKQEFLVASTYDKLSKRIRDGIEFTSQTTGNFCIGLYFTDGKKGCGVGITSFLPS